MMPDTPAPAAPSHIAGFDRRTALATLGLGALAAPSSLGAAAMLNMQGDTKTSPLPQTQPVVTEAIMGWDSKTKQYILPPLPYASDALEPHIDKATMELHHGKHHAGYVKGLNTALQKLADMRKAEGAQSEFDTRAWMRELAFHGSGHMLHVLFWNCMAPPASSKNPGTFGRGGGEAGATTIGKKIDADFGSYKAFSDQFQTAANAVQGSGWAILCYEPIADQLVIMQAEKHQDVTTWGVRPLLPIDVWEHAYYLKYQNRRKDYVTAFMNLINWDWINRRFENMTRK